jgi:hypothetical protein
VTGFTSEGDTAASSIGDAVEEKVPQTKKLLFGIMKVQKMRESTNRRRKTFGSTLLDETRHGLLMARVDLASSWHANPTEPSLWMMQSETYLCWERCLRLARWIFNFTWDLDDRRSVHVNIICKRFMHADAIIVRLENKNSHSWATSFI